MSSQQGIDFTWEVPAGKFDAKGQPTQMVRASSAGARTESTEYDDRPAKWVLGQVRSVTEASTGHFQY